MKKIYKQKERTFRYARTQHITIIILNQKNIQEYIL